MDLLYGHEIRSMIRICHRICTPNESTTNVFSTLLSGSDSSLLTLARNWCLGRFYVLADALNLMRYSGSATERERERFVGVARTWPGSWPGHACGRRAFGGWVSGLFGGCAVRTGLRVVKRDVDPGRLQVIHCRVIEHVTMARAHVGRERVAHPLAVCADDNSACQAACTHQAYVEYPSLMPQPLASLCVTMRTFECLKFMEFYILGNISGTCALWPKYKCPEFVMCDQNELLVLKGHSRAFALLLEVVVHTSQLRYV